MTSICNKVSLLTIGPPDTEMHTTSQASLDKSTAGQGGSEYPLLTSVNTYAEHALRTLTFNADHWFCLVIPQDNA